MIYVYITKELRPFETDIRDLCLAFFTLQKITYIFDDVGADTICQCEGRACELRPYSSPDIVVKDYYNGTFDADRLTVKSEVKRQLYNYLSRLTGKKLLWGTLTGIRPVNIVTSMLEERARETRPCDGGSASVRPYEYSVRPCDEERHNRQPVAASCTSGKSVRNVMGLSPITEIDNPIYKENEKIKEYLKKEYYISDEKAFELIKIARNEIKILERPEVRDYKNSYSVYVGVPFCKSTCLYCSFTSFNIEKFGKYVDRYLETIERDFNSRVGKIVGKRALQAFAPTNTAFAPTNTAFTSTDKLQPLTLYIGGGTPTSLDENAFERLLTIIDKYVDRSKCIEYTVEAGRPDTITKEKLLIMKRHGVSRISINPQSFNQKTLDLIGRKHTVEDVIEKFKLARELGFDNINMDIILGLPNEHLFDVLKTLNGVRKLKPDSFTVHSLALKRAARLNFELAEWTKNYYLAGVGKREIDSMFKWSERLAEHLKLKPYYLYRQKNIAGNLENVGYAKEGKECIYNIMMMSERHSVYGFGTATTKEVFYENDGKRIESEEGYKSVIDYCERVGS